jgi:hypothetical protein
MDSEGLIALKWAVIGDYWGVFDAIAKKKEEEGDNKGASSPIYKATLFCRTKRSLNASY